MDFTVHRVHIGHPDYEQVLGRLLDDPPACIWADAEIDMSRAAQQNPDRIWWVATADDDGEVLAFCAAWPEVHDGREVWVCGSNYEMPGRGREHQLWPWVFTARHTETRSRDCIAWIFDQPLWLFTLAGWTATRLHGTSREPGLAEHHWQELTRPADPI